VKANTGLIDLNPLILNLALHVGQYLTTNPGINTDLIGVCMGPEPVWMFMRRENILPYYDSNIRPSTTTLVTIRLKYPAPTIISKYIHKYIYMGLKTYESHCIMKENAPWNHKWTTLYLQIVQNEQLKG